MIIGIQQIHFNKQQQQQQQSIILYRSAQSLCGHLIPERIKYMHTHGFNYHHKRISYFRGKFSDFGSFQGKYFS